MISFKDKVNNLIDSGKPARLRFLTLAEQAYVSGIIKYDKELQVDGGYPFAERKRALYQTTDNFITCFKIEYDKRYLELTHQNILGSLLSLNITRDSVGDILPNQAVFFVTKELEREIIHSFVKINGVPITLIDFDPSLLESETEFVEYATTVSSKRLDNIVSKITKKSRNDVNEYINKEYIKVNHQVCVKTTKIINDLDVLSIRHFGRYKIIDTNKTSKKGKIIVNYVKFV